MRKRAVAATVATAHPIKARKPFESVLFEFSCSGGVLVRVDCDPLNSSTEWWVGCLGVRWVNSVLCYNTLRSNASGNL